MNREAPSRAVCALLIAALSVSPLSAATRPDESAVAGTSTMGRVPAAERSRIDAILPQLPPAAAAKLRSALAAFDDHSSYWQSLKWATDHGGAVLAPLAASVGIAGAGYVLGNTALDALAFGGPLIWGIGAVAGLGGAAGLVYYEHTHHWYPQAVAALDGAIGEAERAARASSVAAATQPAQPAGGSGGSLALLGVVQQN